MFLSIRDYMETKRQRQCKAAILALKSFFLGKARKFRSEAKFWQKRAENTLSWYEYREYMGYASRIYAMANRASKNAKICDVSSDDPELRRVALAYHKATHS